ncbi:MAG: HAD family hydrolase [Thomasclavelia sp.]|nr:HAD family hydrolase [Thomasclavelia sp.]
MKTKVALFDFDRTIIHGDSGSYLLSYYIKKHPLSVFRLLQVGILYIGYLLHFCKINAAKTKWLFPIDKMSEEEIEEFYDSKVAIHYYDNVVERIKELHEEGYYIIICSASVEAYLKYCKLPVDKIIGTRTLDIDGKLSGRMIGLNCKDNEKVIRINEVLLDNHISIDYNNSYAYSDSKSDIPMLNLVKHRIRIDTKDGKMSKFIY